MSDFLTRLAERALGLAHTAQPLIAPRFAAGPPLAEGATDTPLLAEAVGEEPSAPNAAMPAGVQRTLQAATITPPLVGTREALHDRGAAQAPPARGMGSEIGPLRGKQDASAQEAGSLLEQEGGSTLQTHPLPAGKEDTGRLSRRSGEPARAGPLERVLEREWLSYPTLMSQPATADERPAGPALVPQMPLAGRAATARNLTLEGAMPQTPGGLGLSRPEPSRADHALPTIRVTIGRVEVRAIMPAPPAEARPAPARPSPALSLDEYLRRRDGEPR